MAEPTKPEDLAKLRAEVERLTKALEKETVARSAAEERAEKSASQQLLGSQVEEVPTGKKIKVKKAKDPADPQTEFETIEVPTYFYKVDLPPSGGTHFRVNGVEYYHGETYEVPLDTLRAWKDIVARCWAHENSIRGSNENAYRKPQNRTLRGGARVH